jgi:concanavalin A-like lectin/glucanase superfamily protein/immunoglobulin I-set domain protein
MKTKLPKLRFPRRCHSLLTLAAAAALMCLPLQLLLGSTLDDGLIAYYPFTGNANDASTNGNNGTIVGAQLTTDRNGNPNQAYLFNGTSDYVNIGQGVKPNFPLTVTAWIYPTSVDIESHAIFRSGTFNNAGNYNGVLLSYSGKGFLYGFIGSGPYSSPANYSSRAMTYPPGVIQPNQWTHVALVWIDFQTTKFYMNGVLQTDQPNGYGSGTTIVNTATDGAIGIQDNPSYPAPFMGKLDEIRVYSRQLTPSEINTLAIEPPQVSIQPSSVTTNAGATVVFLAIASGAAPLSYQWQFQGTNINGANSNTLTLTNVKPTDAGTYGMVVRNSVGTNSANATLTVSAQVVSTMPPVFTNGVPFTVAIGVTPPAGTTFYTVQDQPPAGWAVANISSGGTLSAGKVRWIVGSGQSMNLTYVITPPASAVGTNHFAGAAIFNATINMPITGVRDIYNEAVTLSISAVDLFGDGVLYPNLTVFGKAGASYYILVADGLEQQSPWRTNATVTLSGSSMNWLDVEPMNNNPRRFYKTQAAP